MDSYLKKCLSVIRSPFVIYPRLHYCHPYSWLIETHLPVSLDHTILVFFVICRTAQVYYDPAASLVDRFYLTFMSAIYIIIANIYIAVVHTRNTFVPFVRRYIRFLQNGQQNVEEAGEPCTRGSPKRAKLCWLLMASS